MLTRPTTSQLLGVVRAELKSSVARLITEPAAQGALHMIDGILASLSVRAEHEIAWMIEETAAIEQLAEHVLATSPSAEAKRSLDSALRAFRAARTSRLHAADVAADYDRASEVLSQLLEITWDDAEHHEQAKALLRTRIERGVAVAGAASLAGG